MSCGGGNRFQCGITRFQKHSFTPDRPSNAELHNENQMRLSNLLKAREDMDNGFYPLNSVKNNEVNTTATCAMTCVMTSAKTCTTTSATTSAKNTVQNDSSLPTNNTSYTPWVIPSAQNFQSRPN